ncbi:MAG TPA: amidohydrolase family protein [Bryobacteraceae bacterium]|nr:amidohydrolase family protein [Bryobacteraceae bacterium]
MKIWSVVAAVCIPMLGSAQESGTLIVHSLLHAIGEERYELKPSGDDVSMSVSFEVSDRGNKRSGTATLDLKADLTPVRYELKSRTEESLTVDSSAPNRFFVGFGGVPYSVQMMMVRYWATHGKPGHLPILPARAGAEPVEIEPAGQDSLIISGKPVKLTRYTIANVLFGREVLWLDQKNRLAALMTFAGGLPAEAVRSEYESALPELFRLGVAEEMRMISAIERQVRPERTGTFAIVGAKLVDGTGASPVSDSVVLIRDGKIAAAGARGQVSIPKSTPIVDATGKTLLPGLWEMHIHFSGVEFGPALLAAGITSARDCGGEFDFLVAERDHIEKQHGLAPRLLLAGLVDASGLTGFGATFADTPEEARAVVDRYHAAGFQQMKLYTFLKPEVIQALSAEAHKLGMTVTGHVPQSVTTFQGIEAGMDMINHLTGVFQAMRAPGSPGPIDLNSERVRTALQFFKDHRTVIDPTASWGEMAGHTKDVEVPSFEPGIATAPYTLSSKFINMGAAATDSERFHARMQETVAVIRALHGAGITIVPGSDTGLVGYGLLRELELYVQAGMTPMEAIQSATIVSARAMKLDRESGTVEAGKRADLILVDADPLRDISNLRKVSRVVANGWMYDSAKLWKSVGFHPQTPSGASARSSAAGDK